MQFGAVTDIGMHRKINEDNYYVNESDTFPYAVVADGMGGHQAGEVASMMVVDIIENHLEKNLDTELDYVEAGEVIRQAFISANSIIYNYAKNHYKVMGMGTTATLAMIYQNKIITAHVKTPKRKTHLCTFVHVNGIDNILSCVRTLKHIVKCISANAERTFLIFIIMCVINNAHRLKVKRL